MTNRLNLLPTPQWAKLRMETISFGTQKSLNPSTPAFILQVSFVCGGSDVRSQSSLSRLNFVAIVNHCILWPFSQLGIGTFEAHIYIYIIYIWETNWGVESRHSILYPDHLAVTNLGWTQSIYSNKISAILFTVYQWCWYRSNIAKSFWPFLVVASAAGATLYFLWHKAWQCFSGTLQYHILQYWWHITYRFCTVYLSINIQYKQT